MWRRIKIYLAVMGPGLLAAAAGNDAAGVATYSSVGAAFGYRMLWLLLFSTALFVIAQEMNGRLAMATHSGLSDLIRENFGVKWTALVILVLLVANSAYTFSDFAGVAAAFEVFGVPRSVAVPLIAVLVWFLVVFSNYQKIQRVLLLVLSLYLAYPLAAYIVKPDWQEIVRFTFVPSAHWLSFDSHFLTTALALVGTTVAPWMLFFTQASVVEKGVRPKDFRLLQADLITGPIIQFFISASILVLTAHVLYFGQGPQFLADAADAAQALQPVAGEWALILFAVGLLAASLFGCVALPVATAYAVSEALGWERGLDHRLHEAKTFYITFTLVMALGALLAVFPGLTLFRAIVVSQTLNGILLPIILIFTALLLANGRLMGRFQPGRLHRFVFWFMTAAIILLSILLLFATLWPTAN